MITLNKVIDFSGYSNSGKTTLICKIIEELNREFKIAVIKHHGHSGSYSNSQNQKDTDRYLSAGAAETCLLIGDEDPEDFIRKMLLNDNDLVIIEGYKHLSYPKFFIKRQNVMKMDYNKDNLIGIISDFQGDAEEGKPWFHIDDVINIVDFIKNSILKGD